MKEYQNFNSAKISWFRCGGEIAIFCIAENINELKQILQKYKQYNDKILLLGAGSNILIRDCGFQGLGIKLTGDFAKKMVVDDNKIIVGSGCFSQQLSQFALQNNLIGCEFLNTIPGTVGGVVKMNAGCFGKEVKDIFVSCQVLLNGEVKFITKEEINFSYRCSDLPENAIILEATFLLKKGTTEEVENSKQIIKEMQKHRQENQIIGATCGSTFANPINKNGEKISAWKLIDECGLRGMQIGGAKISEKHCNFFVNTGHATATDIENLINLTKQKVKEKFDIELNTEIRII